MDREPLSCGMTFQRMGSRLDIVPQRHQAGAPGHSCRKQNHIRGHCWWRSTEGWCNTRPNNLVYNPDYNYQALGSWDTNFPLPSQAAGTAHTRAGTGERPAAGGGGGFQPSVQAGCWALGFWQLYLHPFTSSEILSLFKSLSRWDMPGIWCINVC